MVRNPPTVGVLALQGDFAEHVRVLTEIGVATREVRNLDDLKTVDALIIPGGESTVMNSLLTKAMREEIGRRHTNGTLPIYGTCAGAILLAKEVTGKNPPQTLKLMDIGVERNAYGTQLQSFQASLDLKEEAERLLATFIRSPKITRVGNDAEVLASYRGDPVLVRQGSLLAGTFHPEVEGEQRVHTLFLRLL